MLGSSTDVEDQGVFGRFARLARAVCSVRQAATAHLREGTRPPSKTLGLLVHTKQCKLGFISENWVERKAGVTRRIRYRWTQVRKATLIALLAELAGSSAHRSEWSR